MLAIKDLNNEVYLLSGASEIKRVRRVNGEKEFSFTLEQTKNNAHFFDDIEKLWRVIDFNGEEYPVLLYRDIAEGEGYVRQFSCLHSFFDDMRNHVVYEKFTGSRTFLAMLQFIFTDSGYSFNIQDNFYAQQFENFGDDYGLELFKTALERYGAEFTVEGTVVTLRAKIGDTTDFQYRHKFNLESIEREVDALDFSTYGEGYGKNGLKVTYTSPLAALYGKRSIKAYRNENFSIAANFTERIKEMVDSTLKIALTVKLSDLRASGYNKNHPNEGDTIILVDDRFGLKVDTRIVEITESFHPNGTVLDCDVMLSNFSNIFEQQRRIHNATKTLADAIEGKRPLPFEALAYATQQATIALQNAQTEIQFPDNGGLLAVDKTNPNNMVIYNSAGIGISSDGGQTFKNSITGKGVVTETLTAGQIDANLINIFGGTSTNYTNIQGASIISRGQYTRTWQNVTELHDVSLRFENGYFRASNLEADRNLYYSDFGISTYASGNQDLSSGTIEFFSYEYDPVRKGVTISSVGGVVALRSSLDKVILDALDDVYLRSQGNQVKIQPRRDTVLGNNTFAFHVLNNEDASFTDGMLYYGSENTPQFGAGIRFSKSTADNTIYITDGTYTRNTGRLSAKELNALDKVTVNGNEVYVNSSGFNTLLMENKPLLAGGLRTNSTSLYMGVDGTADGELKVTGLSGFNNGQGIVYNPIRASEYRIGSSMEYKTNIEPLQTSGLYIIEKLNMMQYHLKADVANGIYYEQKVGLISELSPEVATHDMKAVDINKLLNYTVKAVQEQQVLIRELRAIAGITEGVGISEVG